MFLDGLGCGGWSKKCAGLYQENSGGNFWNEHILFLWQWRWQPLGKYPSLPDVWGHRVKWTRLPQVDLSFCDKQTNWADWKSGVIGGGGKNSKDQ